MLGLSLAVAVSLAAVPDAGRFEGQFFAGRGDTEYLQLLEISGRMFAPDAEFQNLPMLYTPSWNGLVEGPTWGAWWIQNSYGPTYCALPIWDEPYTTWIQNSQDLWFSQMGDGKHKGVHDWVAPDGCLCDTASPGWIVYKQGDGKIGIHDWGMEFTAAGVVMQSELLLIGRDPSAIAKYLPKLERCANFIESRRDPANNLFLAGPAGNLLAPSYAGYKKPDGTYDKAYLAGLSITYIAALDRLIELEKMAGRGEQAAVYVRRRALAREGLAALATPEGYFVKYIDPDGTKHGVYGAEKHGYFEAVCNHDAICFRVADDEQAMKIYNKIASIPGLRKYDLIVTNFPALDDMYEKQESIWKFGTWVNGGEWTTCEARMMMGYYRLGKYEDARRSMNKILDYARRFRMDNPLVDFGNDVYQPHQPINCVYDNWGVPGALIRGLFEYIYTAEGVKILPHIPPGITQLEQKIPVRFGRKRLYLSTSGTGPVTAVRINGQPYRRFDEKSIQLTDDATPEQTRIEITLGQGGGSFLSQGALPPPRKPLPDITAFSATMRGNELPVRIGADSNGKSCFVGELRRVRIYAKPLTGEEIAALAGGTEAEVKSASPLGDWVCDAIASGVVGSHASDGLPAKVAGEVSIVETDKGTATRFSGDGWLEIPDEPRLSLDDGFTLDAWIRPTKLPDGGMRIIDKCTAGTSDGYTFDTYPKDGLRLITPYGSVACDARLEAGQWVHVAATFDPSGELAIYLNGKKMVSGAVQPRQKPQLERISNLCQRLEQAGLGDTYEGRHARLVVDYAATILQRRQMLVDGRIKPLPEPGRQVAADRSYVDTVVKLAVGLQIVLDGYGKSKDPGKRKVYGMWQAAGE